MTVKWTLEATLKTWDVPPPLMMTEDPVASKTVLSWEITRGVLAVTEPSNCRRVVPPAAREFLMLVIEALVIGGFVWAGKRQLMNAIKKITAMSRAGTVAVHLPKA
jgi:hypothetical protein